MLKTILLLADISTAPRFGLTYMEFAAYLFGLWPFTSLIMSQLGIIASSIAHLHGVRRGSKTPA